MKYLDQSNTTQHNATHDHSRQLFSMKKELPQVGLECCTCSFVCAMCVHMYGERPCTEVQAADGALLLHESDGEWVVDEHLEHLTAYINRMECVYQ